MLLRSSRPLKYFSMMERSLGEATSLVVMVMPFRDVRIQSEHTLDLCTLRRLLMAAMCLLALL